ncbi:hypothetical protein RM697_10310 [Ichthyenterobacterium sp. W332]|uniref:Anti-sigma factor n=1 Tax=Microcosmobacter mediterraneus TaxID=3075607 RepID=A0ABU2YLL7_9FLAO|nr:hypothetical protein [Ichthyenterobacterium sp. W332]MDT0559043.1 hypothetical protein [Ichthyenterobacterium sp. W332]
MAPIKFEDNMREKLERRTIQPSAEAWSTLSNRLDDNDKSNSKKGLWWLGIAASIALLIYSGIIFFEKENESISTEIVDKPLEEIQIIEQNPLSEASEEKMAVKETDYKEIKESKNVNSANEIKQIIDTKKQKPVINDLAYQPSENKVSSDLRKEELVTSLVQNKTTFEEQKFKEVMAEIKTLHNDGSAVTNREIDSLLTLAQKELFKDKLFKENSKTVDADALLEGVETELEQSFRTRVFKAIKSNYETVKTAVAERNN